MCYRRKDHKIRERKIETIFAISYLIPFFFFTVIPVLETIRLRKVMNGIDGIIKSRQDLIQVKNEIQIDLYLGIGLISSIIGMALLTILRQMIYYDGIELAFYYLLVMIFGGIVSFFTIRPTEKRFMSLKVKAEEQSLSDEYQYYVKQWKGFHFILKPPEKAASEDESKPDKSQKSQDSKCSETEPPGRPIIFAFIEVGIILFVVISVIALIVWKLIS